MEQGKSLQLIRLEGDRCFQTHKYRLIKHNQKSIEIM